MRAIGRTVAATMLAGCVAYAGSQAAAETLDEQPIAAPEQAAPAPATTENADRLVVRDVRVEATDTGRRLVMALSREPEGVSNFQLSSPPRMVVDLHEAGCDLITITQYLRPSVRHHPVERWVKPEEFVELKTEADEIGFAGVMSGPLVRSSYRAGSLYKQAIESGRGSAALRNAT